jgi:hypothetical protein
MALSEHEAQAVADAAVAVRGLGMALDFVGAGLDLTLGTSEHYATFQPWCGDLGALEMLGASATSLARELEDALDSIDVEQDGEGG